MQLHTLVNFHPYVYVNNYYSLFLPPSLFPSLFLSFLLSFSLSLSLSLSPSLSYSVSPSSGGIVLGINAVGRRTGEATVALESKEQADLGLKRHKHYLNQRYVEVWTDPSIK